MADVPMIGDPVLAVAVRAARRAASVIVDAGRDLKRLPTFAKEHGEIASSARDEARSAIVATIGAAFPEHAILGEDAGDANDAKGGSPYRWIVDPIDGGTNFAHGYPHYAVSIALAHGTDVTHAAVLDPAHDELYTAVRGKGAQLNGAPIRVSACTRLEDALVGTVFPGRGSARIAAYLPVMTAVMTRCAGLRRAGACSLDLAYVAAGRLDGFFVTSRQAGDIAAGALLVKEAGGRVGDFAGGVEFLRTSEVIAASPGLFAPLREAIAAVRA
ncbi:myo-inositol-1(or 4)-monophosphatase [Burkholderiales bacterium]|nr:myo-inositol-1(or 4)-monophosphatase [Burkholderiales bacterium]